nr:MAG TPA: hypothetical protein [Caudoviricetes sp.]
MTGVLCTESCVLLYLFFFEVDRKSVGQTRLGS